MSDREREFIEFKLKCNTLCKAATTTLLGTPTSILDAAATTNTTTSLPNKTLIQQTLRNLSSSMGESYRSFPLLCSRTPQRFNESTTSEDLLSSTASSDQTINTNNTASNSTTTSTSNSTTNTEDSSTNKTTETKKPSPKKKKKKKKQKPPLPAWKRELQERRGLRKSSPATTSTTSTTSTTQTNNNNETKSQSDTSSNATSISLERTNICRRTVAVSYNNKTHAIRWGVSGQLKNQKIHKSIWGKSLIKGRPRGTCAEFHVVNESLLAEEGVEDMCMYVSDLVEGVTKPRCRNCLYISSNALCFSDDLIFDGNTDKKSKFEWQGEGVFKSTK